MSGRFVALIALRVSLALDGVGDGLSLRFLSIAVRLTCERPADLGAVFESTAREDNYDCVYSRK